LIIIGFGLIAWLFWKKRHREALLVFLMLAAVTAGSEGVKQLVGRPRPSGNGDGIPGVVYSYPSGHVLEVLTILGIVAVRTWRSSRQLVLRLVVPILVVFEALLVGFGRMALNAHYPTDVLAGLLGGTAAVGLYIWFTRPGAWATKLADDGDHATNSATGR
jgi:undecaprenyl-diphosphatase